MSQEDMHNISAYVNDQTERILKHMQEEKAGKVDTTIAEIAFNFGIKWDTARERFKVVRGLGMIEIRGNDWMWIGKELKRF